MLHSFSVPVLALKAFPRMGLSGFDLLPWLSWFSGHGYRMLFIPSLLLSLTVKGRIESLSQRILILLPSKYA